MISVLTLVKNRESHLRRLVEGLERSVERPAELVIVDMSDTPIACPVTGFPTVMIRHETSGLPLAQARNLAARRATSPRLLFLDVDCIPSRSLSGVMDDALSQQDALICAEILYLGPDDLGDGPWNEEALVQAGVRHPIRAFPARGLAREDNPGLFWSLAFGVSADTFCRLGGFDEAFSGYGAEDTDFGFAARKAGVDLLFLGGVPVFHQYHGVVDPPLQHFADIIRNATIFHRKWDVWPMEGWLNQFRDQGLIVWNEARIEILRPPTAEDRAKAAGKPGARF